MKNDVDLYAKDPASLQMNNADVDPEIGCKTDSLKVYAIYGENRRMDESGDCILRLANKDGLITNRVF